MHRSTIFILVAVLCVLFLTFGAFSQQSTYVPNWPLKHTPDPTPPTDKSRLSAGDGRAWTFDPARDARNLGLSDEQCDV